MSAVQVLATLGKCGVSVAAQWPKVLEAAESIPRLEELLAKKGPETSQTVEGQGKAAVEASEPPEPKLPEPFPFAPEESSGPAEEREPKPEPAAEATEAEVAGTPRYQPTN